MRNVLFVVPDFYPDSTGFANACHNLIQSIVKYGSADYRIYVFTTTPLNGEEELRHIKVFRYKSRIPDKKLTHGLHQVEKYAVCRRLIEQYQIDDIFLETNTFPYFENLLVRNYKDRVFVRIHSTMDTEAPVFHRTLRPNLALDYFLERRFMNRVSHIVSASSYYLDFVKSRFYKNNIYDIWEHKSYSIIHNTAGGGITDPEETDMAEQSGNVFLTLGKMSRPGVIQKGFTDLFRAVYFLKEKGAMPADFMLHVIGDGERAADLRMYVKKLCLENNIRFLGALSHEQVIHEIQKSKAVLLLSRFEGQSMFITETLACGRPVILSDHNGMADLIVHGQNGYLCGTGDPVDAALKISRLLSLDERQVRNMGACSRGIYEEKFSEKAVYEQFDNTIRLKT